MYVSTQLIDFLEFIVIGGVIGITFDFFRGYRKIKKVGTVTVVVQDVIYFVMLAAIIVFSIVKLLNSQIRLYIFIAIILGCSLYFSILSKFVIKIYILFFKMFKEIISTVFLPILLELQIFQKIGKILKKICKKCCKMFSYMISFMCKFGKNKLKKNSKKIDGKNKRGFKFMRKKSDSNNAQSAKKRKFGIIHIALLLFGVYFVYTLVQQQIQINKYNSQIEMYSADIKTKKELTEYYNSQKGNTKTDEYIENVARENLGYVKPYEKIFVDVNK